MTARQVFEATGIELSKIQAPRLKLYEFNYLFNKAINQYINKVYNVYDINQQTTDDLRVLKSTAYLVPEKYELSTGNSAVANVGKSEVAVGEVTTTYKDGSTKKVTTSKESDGRYKVVTVLTSNENTETTTEYINGNVGGQASSYLSKAHNSIQSLHGATYQVEMPMDYLHMLNCVCIYYVAKTKDCWDAGSYIEVPATRLTADSWSQIVTDIYNRPSPMKPYYYIHNVAGTGDFNNIYKVTSNGTWNDGSVTEDPDSKSNFDRTFKLNDTVNASVVEKPIASRIGNASKVRCEIRYGNKFE